jgi:hypothetical protein
VLAAHVSPAAQRGHAFAPPQSTPVSTPFLTLSVHDGAAHRLFAHTPLTQSDPVPHGWAVGQRGQVLAPPQSTPLSRPFLTVSVQVGTAQAPATQTPLAQFAPLVPHIFPSAHGRLVGAGAHEPPQSTSVSLPFLIVSLQLAGEQVPFGPQMPFMQSPATVQARPSPHVRFVGAIAHEPPQSTAVSLPFLTVSVQVGAAHAPAVQTPLAQFAPLLAPLPHIFPVAQGGQLPPQSTSVSVPFLVVSAHEAAAHTPLTQTPLVQSPGTVQARPSAHLRLVGVTAHEPPQSTAVSLPFLTVSVQDGTAHAPLVHTPLAQFAPLVAPLPHIFPLAQVAHEPPPQSTSVSLPFRTVSVQLPGWQRPPVQTPLVQLAPLAPHVFPSTHLRLVGAAAHEPPQSTSVSLPFAIVSLHDAGVQVPVAPHTPLAQSPPPPHFFPSAHRSLVGAAAHEPPQSTSVSLPFAIMSLHDGIAQTCVAAGQTPLVQSVTTPQVFPASQAGQALPPQSMSASLPFLMPSVQLGAWQRPPMQLALAQSAPRTQALPGPHAGQPEPVPPQSTSLSVPFFTVSAQVRATHRVAVQTRLPQSPPILHFLPVPQPAQGPPQSTSVSALFLTASAHEGVAQTPAVQTPLMQSPASTQVFRSWQAPQAGPPQSTSVSVPFLIRSPQLALSQMPVVQTPPAQSAPTRQYFPVRHFVAQVPPQSTSVSEPFSTASVQLPVPQIPAVQTPSLQSFGTTHGCPLTQAGQVPPQSTPVSLAFLTASAQVATAHMPPVQTPLVQSKPIAQLPCGGQGAHDVPPQSTSVSVPFISRSVQDGISQVPPVHVPLVQSPTTRHPLPTPQGPHALPPQSTSVSVPSFIWLAQPSDWQIPAEQTPAAQSTPTRHIFPLAQRPQMSLPPQSMSVSPPFFRWSTHEGVTFPGEPASRAGSPSGPASAPGTPPSGEPPLVRV